MADLEKLTNEIIEYLSGSNWYDICDNYGNIETDSEARKILFYEIYSTLLNKPEDIIKTLKADREEMKFEKDYKKDKEFKDISNLITRIKRSNKRSISEKIENAKEKSKEQKQDKNKNKNKNISL